MPKKTKIYLLSGRTGAGKTTIAKRMATELPAFRISHDELLSSAYGENIEKEKFKECCERINAIVWKQIEQLSKLGIDIVLEGWGTRSLRDQARSEIQKIGVDHEFLYIECPQELRLQRVRDRNESSSHEGVFISDEEFWRMEKIKEEFDDDEKCTIVYNGSSSTETKGI